MVRLLPILLTSVIASSLGLAAPAPCQRGAEQSLSNAKELLPQSLEVSSRELFRRNPPRKRNRRPSRPKVGAPTPGQPNGASTIPGQPNGGANLTVQPAVQGKPSFQARVGSRFKSAVANFDPQHLQTATDAVNGMTGFAGAVMGLHEQIRGPGGTAPMGGNPVDAVEYGEGQ